MADQHRRIHDEDYRRGGRQSWSERARHEARPWLRDDGMRWRPDEGQREAWDGSFAGPGERSWRDQADGSYERSSSYRDGDRGYGRGSHYERTPRSGDSASQWGRESFAGRGPKGYTRSDDRIKEDVSEQLMDDDDIDASEITVQVARGEVTLTGTVEDRHQKRRAEDIVECVSGVSEVTNRLRIGRPESQDFSTSGQTRSGARSSASPASGSSKATKPTNRAS